MLRRQTTVWKAFKTHSFELIYFMSFNNNLKSKTILKTSLDPHVVGKGGGGAFKCIDQSLCAVWDILFEKWMSRQFATRNVWGTENTKLFLFNGVFSKHGVKDQHKNINRLLIDVFLSDVSISCWAWFKQLIQFAVRVTIFTRKENINKILNCTQAGTQGGCKG